MCRMVTTLALALMLSLSSMAAAALHRPAGGVVFGVQERGWRRVAGRRRLVVDRGEVENLADGIRVDRIQAHPGDATHDPRGVVSRVMELYLQMMLVDGVFHADPHPGNLLVRADGALVLLDFGMVIEVDPVMRHHLVHTALAAVRGDADKVVDGFFNLGIVAPETDRETIRRLVGIIMELTERGAELGEVQAALADEVMHLLYDWPVVLTGEMTYFGRAVALIEGLGAHHIPNFNPVTYVRPLLLKHRMAVLRALGPTDNETADLAFALGLLSRDVMRVVGNAGRELLGVLATRIPSVLSAFTRPALARAIEVPVVAALVQEELAKAAAGEIGEAELVQPLLEEVPRRQAALLVAALRLGLVGAEEDVAPVALELILRGGLGQ